MRGAEATELSLTTSTRVSQTSSRSASLIAQHNMQPSTTAVGTTTALVRPKPRPGLLFESSECSSVVHSAVRCIPGLQGSHLSLQTLRIRIWQ